MSALVAEAEEQIAALGQVIRAEVPPAADESEVSAVDGRMYEAAGPKWHKSSREAGVVPVGLRNVDTESKWSKSGSRGWVQGYRLLLQGLVFPAPVPLFATWRANNENEAHLASEALAQGRLKVSDVLLGDETFGGGDFPQRYAQADGCHGHPSNCLKHVGHGRMISTLIASRTIEVLFQRIIQAAGLKQCPVKGAGRNGAYVLASVWLYQICFLANYRAGQPLAYIKDHLDCARWRIASG